MDPRTATQFAQRSAAILLLDTPEGLDLSLDLFPVVARTNFSGFKMIPAGIHFLAFGARDGLRTGLFLALNDEVAVFRWNTDGELFESVSEADHAAYSQGVRNWDFDAKLVPFTVHQEGQAQWESLSSHISEAVLKRLNPIGGWISSTSGPLTKEEEALLRRDGKSYSATPDTVTTATTAAEPLPFYSPVARRVVGDSADATTALNLDKSGLLEQIVGRNWGGQHRLLLGELQYAFVSFVLCISFHSFEQWKALVLLICNCDALVCRQPVFFEEFAAILRCHLEQAPDDFLTAELGSKNFLIPALKTLFELTEDVHSPVLGTALAQLRQFAERKFSVSFSITALSDDEDGPVIVDL